MAKRVSVSEARANLPALLDEVAAGEEVTITRHGTPVAVLVPPRRLRHPAVQKMMDDADRLGEEMAAARHRPIGTIDEPKEYFDEWVQEIYDDRRSR